MKRPTKQKTTEPAPPLRLEWRSPAELTQNPRNWRTHPEAQQKALAGILSEVGWAGACLFNERTGLLIDGHLRQKVAIANGAEKVPVLIGDWSPEQEAKILATLDPVAALAGADPVKLDALLKEVDTGCAEVQQMLADLWGETQADAVANTPPADPVDAEPQMDRAAELQAKWGTAAGQLWLLGKHRLLCGDSTKPEDVGRVMGGETPRMEFSDCPYEIETEGGGVMKQSGHLAKIADAGIDSFSPETLTEAAPTAVFCCNKQLVKQYIELAEKWRKAWDLCFWKKNNTPPNYGGHLMTDVEYLVVIGQQSPISGQDRELYSKAFQSDVVSSGERFVGWQKPIELVQKFVLLFSKRGEIVFDRFLGSGTTLIAAENLGRRCFGLEISPAYCAVILQRYADAFPDQEIRQA